jgi:hypothetical protein
VNKLKRPRSEGKQSNAIQIEMRSKNDGGKKLGLDVFVFRKVVFRKLFFKFSCVCLLLEKLVKGKHFPVNGKYFLVKGKFSLVFMKVFSFYIERKTLSGNCEKFRNVILFADYIKFGPQTFNCYIYFVLNICFSISSLTI